MNPTQWQFKKATDKEHHAIIFLYKANRQRYFKLIEQMENNLLQRKDPFPKSLNDICRILAGWNKRYSNRDNRFTDSINGIALMTSGEDRRNNKKKEITCYKCKKI